jgi:LPS sulfotransferase NodH
VFKSFVVFAEMRTGSNFLEANLNAIPGVKCHGEVFNPYFIGGEGKQDYLGVSIVERNTDPVRLLAAMQEQTRGIAGFRYFHDHDPRVFDLVMNDQSCAKIILTRNQLESYVSWKIAKESDQWWMANTKHLKTVRPEFDGEEFLARVTELQDFQKTLQRRLQTTGQTAFYIDYEDILDLDVLNGLAAHLGATGRLKDLDFRFKKQNPEAMEEKVSNPEDMAKSLAKIDWFSLSHTPNFEPRRAPGVPQYIASAGAPLLFLPIRSAPEQRIKKWLSGFGPILPNFDRNSLRTWRTAQPGHRSFTVLRHPLARAHVGYAEFLRKEWMPELRPYLKRVHKFQLPPKGQGFEDPQEFRAGLLVFLELIKHIAAGRTELRTPAQFASQFMTLQGFGQLQSPDHVLREDQLEMGLAYLLADTGLDAPDLPPEADLAQHPLSALYGPDLEAAARAAYPRDYEAFGFGNWSPT